MSQQFLYFPEKHHHTTLANLFIYFLKATDFMFKKQLLITEMFPVHCKIDFQSHENTETKLPPLWTFFLSHQCELNPIPVQGRKPSFDFKGKNEPFMNFYRDDAFFHTVKYRCLSKRPRFCFIPLSDWNATHMFYLCVKGISAAAGSACEVSHYLFAGFSLPRTTFSTAR